MSQKGWLNGFGGDELRTGLGIRREGTPDAVTYRCILGLAVNIEEFERVMGIFLAVCGG